MNCHDGSIIKGKGAWEPQYESKEWKVCAQGGRGKHIIHGCASYAAVWLIHQSAMRSVQSLHIHGIVSEQ